MQVTTKAIVFSSLKYGDTSLIVKALTDSHGLKSYMLRGVLGSKKGKLKAAYFQPLMQLELVAIHKNKGALEQIREARVSYPYKTLYLSPTKNAITLFLAEMLRNAIHEEEQNPLLFEFLETSLQWLDTHEQVANFHLGFLLALTRYLGFYPDTRKIEAPYFDLVEGEFCQDPGNHPFLSGKNADLLKAFLGINFDDFHIVRIGKAERQAFLKELVLYFELHLHGFKKPRSLAILNEVFS